MKEGVQLANANIPNRPITISDVGTDYWDFQLKVNRALWRDLSFGSQAEINRAMTDLQLLVNSHMESQVPITTAKLLEKNNATKTNQKESTSNTKTR